LTKVLGAVVFGVATTDAIAFAVVASGALGVALLACYVTRASRHEGLIRWLRCVANDGAIH
jgi:hypothetical protein